MCSYQNTYAFGSENIQWEDQIMSEYLLENQSYDVQVHINVGDNQEEKSELSYHEDAAPFASDNVNQIGDNNSNNSILLSPAWDETKQFKSQNTLNMSTYFSTFNPVQPQTQIPYPVTSTSVKIRRYQNNYNNALEKIHRARISLVPTSSGNFKPVVKRTKRKRTIFTTEQVEALEMIFAKKPYVTKEERQIIVNELKLTDKSVKIWFQNRRLKVKREDSDGEGNQEVDFSRLDYVESKINERTDEFGFVTLDDKIMEYLVALIDEYLSIPVVPVVQSIKVEPPLYEPISPASTVDEDSNEGSSSFDDTVQQLMDIESIISVN